MSDQVPDIWKISLSSWIIQDGNYPDFAAGETRRFAIEFYAPDGLRLVPPGERRAVWLRDSQYEVRGILSDFTRWCVIDCGLLVYREDRISGTRDGGGAEGSVSLGVDPYFYMEYLHKHPNAPAMVYAWRVELIEKQTAPFVESRGRNVWIRDPDRLGWETIGETDAWNDDGGNADYLLTCRLIDVPPQHTP